MKIWVKKLQLPKKPIRKNNSRRERNFLDANKGQVKKGAGRMPWHWEPKKDVISCDKLRGMANTW